MRYGRMRLTMSELAAELGIKEGSLRNLISDDKCAVATYTEDAIGTPMCGLSVNTSISVTVRPR